jgi:Zn-dependent M28 family amino/carboxypeptidase
MTDWIGRTFISDAGWNHLEALVSVGSRMAGSDGEREALELTRDALADAGARDTRIDEFGIRGWERGDSELRAGEGDDAETFDAAHQCTALPRSPDASATGELVDLGHGTPEEFAARDVEGKVVRVSATVPDDYDRFVHRREKYYRAVEGGAAAFVFENHVEGCLPPTGSVGTAESPVGEIPALGVSREAGARLRRRFEGEPVAVAVDCDLGEATSGNVHAELGPDTSEELLVTCHVDAHDVSEGAMDNGAGTATVVEVARALADRETELDTRVRFVAFGAEEVGLAGSEHEADRADRDAIRAVVNLDSNVGGRTLTLDAHGFAELEDAAERVADRFDHPVSASDELVPHSDHWSFVEHGVPGYMISAESEGRDRGWGHTHADTLDKLESRTLREQAILLTELVVDLADAEANVDHRDPEGIAADLEAADLAAGMKVTGDWPYDG